MREAALGLAAVLALAGCQALGMKDDSSVELERNFQDSDRKVREHRTFSALAEMETALAGYLKHEKRIPERLDELIVALARLDDSFAEGQIGEAEYRRRRAATKQQLTRLMRGR